MLEKTPFLPIILGPTAVGKTALSLDLAECLDAEIVSADSRQVYRLMDIGTAKPSQKERQRVPHHLIDIVWPDEKFNVSYFVQRAEQVIQDVCARGKSSLLVGGTGLYIRALTEGLLIAPGADPSLRRDLHEKAQKRGNEALHAELEKVDSQMAARLHPNDLVRIVRALEVYYCSGSRLSELQKSHGFGQKPYRTLKIGLCCDRERLYEKIDKRSEDMFEEGLIEEAEAILEAGYDPNLKILKTIGYRQALGVLNGKLKLDEALDDLKRSTRRYAKQQLTWFRKDKSIIWLESSCDFARILELVDNSHVI
jgi:tRNA dimethylallyltransferase